MKQKLGIGAALLMAVWLLSGCITFQDSSGKLLASTVQTVDAAMKGWATYVALGGATPQQEAAVKASYEKYQAVERIAERAYIDAALTGNQDGFTIAAKVLEGARLNLLLLIQQFNNPKGQTK